MGEKEGGGRERERREGRREREEGGREGEGESVRITYKLTPNPPTFPS